MRCRWCQREIFQLGLDDEHVYRSSRNDLIRSVNQVDEAWSDGLMYVCKGDGSSEPYRWHEPLILTNQDILEALRLIEADLR